MLAYMKQPPTTGGAPSLVSRACLQADLANVQERNGRMDARIRQLEKKLSELLGEQAWRQSGLGAPEDIDVLKRQVNELDRCSVPGSGMTAPGGRVELSACGLFGWPGVAERPLVGRHHDHVDFDHAACGVGGGPGDGVDAVVRIDAERARLIIVGDFYGDFLGELRRRVAEFG
jgi:hypothetical protein